jgi:hypothetical protein
MRPYALVGLLVTAACGESGPEPIRGPVHTFAVDGYTLPMDNIEARAMGCDLNGDRTVDNQLGMTFGQLARENNLTPYVADLIGSGVLASRVEIQSEDLVDDPVAGLRYIGHDGAPSVQVRGELADGAFVTTERGAGVVRLPVFVDADVSQVQVNALQLALTPDGNGGYDAQLCGAVREAEAAEDAARGLIQMVDNNPADHPYMITLFDDDKNGEITVEELRADSLFKSLLSADVEVDRQKHTALGVRLHLAPCPGGVCPEPAAPTNACHDRAIGGDESDVDCGGTSCLRCAAGLECRGPQDCASNACDAGRCREPSCTDGAWDGFESDVDCGWHCGPCASGQMCERGTDCLTGCGYDTERCY